MTIDIFTEERILEQREPILVYILRAVKKIVAAIVFVLFAVNCFSQDSLNIKYKSIGISATLLNNFSIIDWGKDHQPINSVKRLSSLGYSAGLTYSYRHKKLVYDFAFQYTEENDRFNNVPTPAVHIVLLDSNSLATENYLDYDHLINLYLRYTSISFLFKFNIQPIMKKHFALGFGIGVMPAVICAEKYYDIREKDFVKSVYNENSHDFQVKAVGSIYFNYFLTPKIYIKAAPMASIALIRRSIYDYNIRPINIALELGIFFKIK
jgi:hypothetical protein